MNERLLFSGREDLCWVVIVRSADRKARILHRDVLVYVCSRLVKAVVQCG